MNKKIYLFFFIVCLLPACFFIDEQKGSKHTFLIQAPLDLSVIKNIQETMMPIVDTIIQEELGIQQDKNFPVFFFKKRQAITLYYLKDLNDNKEPLAGLLYLFVEPILEALPNFNALERSTLSSKLEFFGQEKTGLFAQLDLVVLVNDPAHELSKLNSILKKAAHHANEEYKRAYHSNLYAINKSEEYPYVPHITLGHLRTNYIKYLVNDESKVAQVVQRIKQRIIQAVSNKLADLSEKDRSITFETVGIYDPEKRKYIKEVTL